MLHRQHPAPPPQIYKRALTTRVSFHRDPSSRHRGKKNLDKIALRRQCTDRAVTGKKIFLVRNTSYIDTIQHERMRTEQNDTRTTTNKRTNDSDQDRTKQELNNQNTNERNNNNNRRLLLRALLAHARWAHPLRTRHRIG